MYLSFAPISRDLLPKTPVFRLQIHLHIQVFILSLFYTLEQLCFTMLTKRVQDTLH